MALKDKQITLSRAILLAKKENWDTSHKVVDSVKLKDAILGAKIDIIE